MTINVPHALKQRYESQTFSWSDNEIILYALAMGFGDDPVDTRRLAFVYESPLKVMPTLPTVIAWIADPTFQYLGLDPQSALHGEQRIEIHRPVTQPCAVRVHARVVSVRDKGSGRGAVVVTQQELFDVADDVKISTLTTTCFGRSEGGCGDAGPSSPKPHSLPTRDPDDVIEFQTPANLALLYRLTGDRNPIHADPVAAERAGFPRPILHGLCSFGLTCRAVLEAYADYEPSRILSHEARFTAPTFPGEQIRISLWRDGPVVSFRAEVPERGVVVVANGKTLLRG